MYFGQCQDFKLTTELSEKVQYSRNQATKNSLNEAILLTVYVNKWSFSFKIELCVFQIAKTYLGMKVIRIFNTQPVKIPHFKSPQTHKQAGDPIFLLHFYNVHIMNVNHAKFQKKFDSRTISSKLP